jgi:hypothetical protein
LGIWGGDGVQREFFICRCGSTGSSRTEGNSEEQQKTDHRERENDNGMC